MLCLLDIRIGRRCDEGHNLKRVAGESGADQEARLDLMARLNRLHIEQSNADPELEAARTRPMPPRAISRRTR